MSERKRCKKPDYLPIGADVRILRRISREEVTCKIASAPLPHLLHIGEFYTLAKMPEGEAPFWRGSGRKSRERLAWEAARQEIGMYERSELTIL